MLTPKPRIHTHVPPPPETRTSASETSRVGRVFPSLRKLSLSSVQDVVDPDACKTRVVEFDYAGGRKASVLEQLRVYLSSSSSSSALSPPDAINTMSSSPGLSYDEGLIDIPCGGHGKVKRSELDMMGVGVGDGRKPLVLGDLELDERMRTAMRDVTYETW